jgi:hypothetical protein
MTRGHLFAVALAVVASGSIPVTTNGASATAEPVWGNGATATFPVGVQNSTPGGVIGSVSCPTQTDCVAVGSFYNSDGGGESFLMTSTNSAWNQAQAVVPADGISNATYREDGFRSVSCSSVGNCTAVGQYMNASGRKVGFTISSANGSWGQPLSVNFGNGAAQQHPNYADADLLDVTCPTDGNCTAVGYFRDLSNHHKAFAITMSNGTWGLPVVADMTSIPGGETWAQFNSVSCPSVGNCTAVGQHETPGGYIVAFTMTSTNGTWAIPEDVTFSGSMAQQTEPDAWLNSVSCSSPGNCTAVGYFSPDWDYDYYALIVTSTNGSWAHAQIVTYNATLPNTRFEELRDVSCTSPGNCTAVGYYHDATNRATPFTVTSTNDALATAQTISFPAGLQSNDPNALLQSVSCWSAGNCTAVGRYRYDQSLFEGFSMTSIDGTWGPVRVATASIANPNGARVFELFSVACGSTGLCTVGGRVRNASGSMEAFTMRSADAPPPAPSVAPPVIFVPPPATQTPTSTTVVPSPPSTTLPAPSLAEVESLPSAPQPIIAVSSVSSGESVVVSYGGFTPFEYVQLVVASTPQVIGAGYADAQGVVTISGNVPSNLSPGRHTLAVFAPVSGLGFRQPITVSTPSLPVTGYDGGVDLQVALWAVTLGLVALWFARRRLLNRSDTMGPAHGRD